MEIIEGIEALIGKDFTGYIVCTFDKECEVIEYRVQVLDGKLIFGNEDIKKHFVTVMVNQKLKSILFMNIYA